MADTLSKLAKPAGATRTKTRLGRGVGSGLGKTAGRGQKGQYARVARLQAPLRRRADADPAAPAEARLHATRSPPRPPRSTSATSRSSRRAPTSTRRRSSTAASSRGASTASRSSATASSPKAVTVSAHAFSKVGRGEDPEGGRQGRPASAAGAQRRRSAERPTAMSVLSAFANIGKVPELRRRDPLHARAAGGLPDRRLRDDPRRGPQR